MVRKYGVFFSLSALLALLYARLPGPKTSNQDIDPRKKFWCEQEGDGVIIATNAADLSWLSGTVNGIMMQKASWSSKLKRWLVGGEPLSSEVKVVTTSSSKYRLRELNAQVKRCLLSGNGRYAIVTVNMNKIEGGRYNKIGDILVQGRGNGRWEILR